MKANIWMVRSAPEGGIDKLARKKEVVAIGWPEVGDLSLLLGLSEEDAQASLKNGLTEGSYSEEESDLVATQLLRFCQQIQVGDLVVAPTTKADDLLLGLVTSDYEYAPNDLSGDYPHLRRVEWLRQFWVNEVKGLQKSLSESNQNLFTLNAHRDQIAKLDQLAYLRQAEEHKFKADRINRFGLTGFKAFKDTAWLPIQPITLLAGLNSSGKSSVIDAILLLTQTLRAEKRVAENIVLDWSGPFFEVDHFKEMVYDKDELDSYFTTSFELSFPVSGPSVLNEEVKRHLSVDMGRFPIIADFRFRPFSDLRNNPIEPDILFTALSNTDPDSVIKVRLIASPWIDLATGYSNHNPLKSLELKTAFSWSYFLPVWEEKEELISTEEDKERFEIYTTYRDLFQPAIKTIQDELLYRIKYLGPLRDEPQRSYRQKRLHGIDVGASGEDAVLLLQRDWQKRVDFVELPEDSHQIVTWEQLFPISMPLGEAVNEGLRWLGMQTLRVQEGFGVVRADFATLSNPEKWVTIADVGFGVSQILPILVLGLLSEPDSILIFEQPEIHLHPRAQARLGELLVCLAKTGRRVLIETHSDHLINRLRRVVAEDLSDQLSDLVNIVFVEPPANGEGATLSPLRVNEEGLIENWPEDFLAETASDARAIVKAGIRKRRMAKQKQA